MEMFFVQGDQERIIDLIGSIKNLYPIDKVNIEVMDCLAISTDMDEVKPILEVLAIHKVKMKTENGSMGKNICPYCGKKFIKDLSSTSDYCSKSCAMKAAYERKQNNKEAEES